MQPVPGRNIMECKPKVALPRNLGLNDSIPLGLVAGCMVADRKVWPGARTGAKGPRPTHGRVGAGLASPAGIGASANVIISRRDYINQPGVDAERLRRVAIAN